ncbi:MAG: methyltransferase [Verrucomicrobia bacterium]|nr:MAG: methyltransferase [Verrucomicrobiota bacterium]
MATQAAQVRKMFGSIARRYDIANHLLSCGMDFYWRRYAAKVVADWRPHSIADLATGTGDLALALQKKLPEAEITGVDFLFDCVTIAFGLRNLENWVAGLTEMARVLKTNGHLLVLEFSLPTMPLLRSVYRFYLHHCLPLFGSFLTGTRNAYDYLGDSIEEFPNGTVMCQLMARNGFARPTFKPLTTGIVTIYTATKR